MADNHEFEPVRNTYLPYGKQSIDEKDIEAVIDVLKGDFLTTGPAIKQFEEKVAQYTGAEYAVAFSNGTAALHAACFAAGIGQEDEVITTPITFAASANCIRYMGGTVVFADIEENTYNIDPKDIKRKITSKTKALIPVDFTGQPAELDEIYQLAEEHNLVVIEDAAHAIGAEYKTHKIGSLSDMTMFSFHPVKHITSGEGGMITTNNQAYYEKLVQFRSHGITRETERLEQNHEPWYYEMQFLGYNYRLTDIQAVLGSSQLDKLDTFIIRRKEIVEQYNNAFKNLESISIPYQNPHVDSSWHLYVIRLDLTQLNADRGTIFKELQKQNIGVNVHYIPVHMQPYYQSLGYEYGSLPKAEKLYEEIITLPLFPAMDDQDVADVIKAVSQTVAYYAKHKDDLK